MKTERSAKVCYKSNQYEPLHFCFTESRDITSFINIDRWANELLSTFELKIGPYIGTREVYTENLEVFTNQLTLLLMLIGEYDHCERYCKNVVEHYFNEFNSTGDVAFLGKMVQPSINLARLYRLTKDILAFWSLFSNFDYYSDDSFLYNGYKIEKDLFSPEIRVLLQSISISERIKAFFLSRDFQKIIEMEDWLPSGPKPLYFWEAKSVALIKIGDIEKACSLILSLMKKVDGAHKLVFYFRLAEVFRCSGQIQEAEVMLCKILEQMSASGQRIGDDPLFISQVLRSLDRPRKEFIDETLADFDRRNDEYNRGLLLLDAYGKGFEEYKKPLVELASHTSYRSLQLKLLEALGFVPSGYSKEIFSELDNCFSRIFKEESV